MVRWLTDSIGMIAWLVLDCSPVVWIQIWIRIVSGFNGVLGSGSGFKMAKMTKMAQRNRKKLINFFFWSDGCSFVKAEGFSCILEVLEISKLHFLIKTRRRKKFQLYFFLNLCTSKSWIGTRIRIHLNSEYVSFSEESKFGFTTLLFSIWQPYGLQDPGVGLEGWLTDYLLTYCPYPAMRWTVLL
jgi:hypothetical protein